MKHPRCWEAELFHGLGRPSLVLLPTGLGEEEHHSFGATQLRTPAQLVYNGLNTEGLTWGIYTFCEVVLSKH